MRRISLMVLLLMAFAVSRAQNRLDLLRGDAASQSFEQARVKGDFQFPRDHGPHPGFRHEWWYVTGQLEARSGERFGFELTFFRYALIPPRPGRQGSGGASAWRSSQIYLAHFAISDLDRHDFAFTERASREALGLAGAQAEPFRVWLEDWALEAAPEGWTLRASFDRYALALKIDTAAHPVPNGDGGLSRKSALPGAASYYYSIPRMVVEGSLTRAGQAPLPVQGTAWLDREWGSGTLAADQQGWDWYALQLDDGSSLMFYALRRRNGSRDPYSAGTWVDASGNARHLSNDDLNIDVLGTWNSPRGGRYPAAWRLRVPALDLDLSVRPQLADQELATSPRYWEGAVSFEGRRGTTRASGKGYVELVGYAVPR